MGISSASVGGCPGVIREECFIETLRGAGGGLQQLHPRQCHHQMSGQAQNILAKPSCCGNAALLSFSTLFPSDLSELLAPHKVCSGGSGAEVVRCILFPLQS